MAEVKIACPKCAWEPDGGPHWMCECGHEWDTFSTAGRCPSCGKQWEHTQCIGPAGGCNGWSPHLDWYRGLDAWLREELARIRERVLVEG